MAESRQKIFNLKSFEAMEIGKPVTGGDLVVLVAKIGKFEDEIVKDLKEIARMVRNLEDSL
jgi:hypothetical protein